MVYPTSTTAPPPHSTVSPSSNHGKSDSFCSSRSILLPPSKSHLILLSTHCASDVTMHCAVLGVCLGIWVENHIMGMLLACPMKFINLCCLHSALLLWSRRSQKLSATRLSELEDVNKSGHYKMEFLFKITDYPQIARVPGSLLKNVLKFVHLTMHILYTTPHSAVP